MSRISHALLHTDRADGAAPRRPFSMAVCPCPPVNPHFQAYIDAFPVAAAVVVLQEGALTVVSRNTLFARLLSATADRSHLVDLNERLCALLVADDGCDRFEWKEPGIGGRHYQVHLRPLSGVGDRLLLSLVDRTAEIETERSLRSEMLRDGLTSLPNRLAFIEAVDQEIAQQGQQNPGFAVLALNLARFSRVNESIGALAGDELIITVARRLVSVMRTGDMLARMAGDEFGIFVRLVDGPGDALHVARRLREALAHPLRLSELEIRIDCAIGCALWNDAAPTAEDMIRNAQFALKRGKQSGRVEVYQPGEANRAHRRFSLETELRRAIDTDQMSLAFQPLVELDSGRISGFEALARWTHPEQGSIPPNEFIPVAEESGLIVPLGRWALDRAASTLAEWDATAGYELPIYLGVNVSPVQLARDRVAEAVRVALDAHGVRGDRLTLELTESSIVADPERATKVLKALKDLSCRVAMDDFGTGYSSLACLQRLPIDVLKIDREFVTGMLDDRDSTAIVRAILSLAAALNMSTIAEGIETQQAAHMLGALGCRVGQGYYFSRPMAASAALAFLLDRKAKAA